MKIAQVLGRGIEGAGVTKYAIELNKYLIKHNIETNVYVVTDKKWGRANFQVFPSFNEITSENINDIIKQLNMCDYIFIHSVPSIKHSKSCIDSFLHLIKSTESKKVFFQNDHKSQSLHRNANLYEICSYCDIIAAFNTTCAFFKKLKENFGSTIVNKYVHLHNGFNFDEILSYRKENHSKKITYLGRFATFKDPNRLLNIIDKTKENNILLEMIGIERSLGALSIFYEDIDKRISNSKIIEVNKKSIEKGIQLEDSKRDLSKVYIWGPYIYNEGLTQLSTALVGCDFFNLDASAYGDNLEYAQCEIVGVGCIPLFDYHWAENCFIHKDGKQTNQRFIDVNEYGLFLKKDCSNIDEIIDKINIIYNNKHIHKRYQECSYEITKNHCDLDSVFDMLINNIINFDFNKEIKSESSIFDLI